MTQNRVDIDKDTTCRYLEQVKDAIKHFFTIVAAILAFSITLSSGQIPAISKILMVTSWMCLIIALIQAALAINTIFIAFSNIWELDFACPHKDDIMNLITIVNNKCYWCIKLFVIGMISLAAATAFRFL